MNNITRRQALRTSISTIGLLAGTTALAKNISMEKLCSLTPVQPKGPFYPVHDQLDKDNDLTLVQGHSQHAKGQLIYVRGLVTDINCAPVAGALVEIWQACESGKYNHPGDPNTAPLDPDFQYWGKILTSANGEYVFKTILPGAYPADTDWIRPPHIHFKVSKFGYHELITQMYFEGDKYNATDKILSQLSEADQKSVIITLEKPSAQFEPDSKIANFDLSLRKP